MPASRIYGRVLRPIEDYDVVELDEILQLTDEMLSCAKNSEWEHLVDVEQVRRKKIAAVFSVKMDLSSSELVAKGVQQLLDRDQKIMSFCREGRSEISKNLRQFRRGKRVHNAYTAA